jgi:integrase
LPNWEALQQLGAALVARSYGRFAGWAHIVEFTACTAARIGETSGVRRADINRKAWTWNVRRQTTPAPGGVTDKGTKGKRARVVPIIPEIRPLVDRRLNSVSDDPMARLFTGPPGGRVTTAVLRDATDWDEVVTALGYGYLRRHDLRHTGSVRTSTPDKKGPGPKVVPRPFEKSSGRRDLNPRPLDPQ